MGKLTVLAVGGNSIIKNTKYNQIEDQYEVCQETARHVIKMIEEGYKIIITHGNGPQVGFTLRRAELAKSELPMVPLDYCGANTQGGIGYHLQLALYNEFKKLGMKKQVATVVTQVLVNRDDPSFQKPTKPVGSMMSQEEAMKHKEIDGWNIVEDSGRGYRRVVPSPKPIDIIELDVIEKLVKEGVIVIAVGGGGIPVAKLDNGDLKGVEAVIDKDHASSLLARKIKADYFVISTAVEKVAINFGKPNQKNLDKITVSEAEKYISEKHFAAGSMLPKIEAALAYVKESGGKALITDPANLTKAIKGETGTIIISK